MKDKQFDRIFREKLSRLDAPLEADSWELFEQKLDLDGAGVPEAEEQMVDHAVFDKLHRLDVPYNEAHWRQLASKLDNPYSLERTLITYKLMELALLALLIFTLFNYFPAKPEPVYQPRPQAEAPALHPSKDQTTLRNREEAGPANQNLTLKEDPGPSGLPSAQLADTPGGELKLRTAEGDIHQPPAQSAPTAEPASQAAAGLLQQRKTDLPALSFPSLAERSRQLANISPVAPEKGTEEPFAFSPFTVDRLNTLEPGALALTGGGAILQAIKPAREPVYTRVSMFSALDYNRILTPPTMISDGRTLDGIDRYALGYGGGITVGIEFGRWEIESGAIYAAKSYRPRQILYILGSVKSGFYGEGIKDVQLNMLQVPLNVRYHFLRKNEWRVYALAGFSAQVAFQANYYVADQNAFNFYLSAPSQSDVSSQESPIDRKNLGNGWFEGGTFEENGYLTGNVGLGVERFLNPRWSLFAQPTYQHSIDYFIQGLGPDRDRINTLSIYSGVRIRLK